jgi:two-component system NtrC family sensor kinase
MNILGLTCQYLLHPDGSLQVLEVNQNCRNFFELPANQNEERSNFLLTLVHPEEREQFISTLMQSAQTLQSFTWEGRYQFPSGNIKWIQSQAEPQVQIDGKILWSVLMVDMTSQKQLNSEVERLSFLLGLTEQLQTSTNLREIARFALEYLVQTTGCAFGDVKVIRGEGDEAIAYPLINQISGEFVATYGQPVIAEMEAVLTQGQPRGQGIFWQVIDTGAPLSIEDYANHPDAIPALRHPGIGQISMFPIPASNGTILGVLTLEARTQQVQSLPQQDLIMAACRILGSRIEQAQAQEHLQHQKQQLEQMLEELGQAQTQLVQSEKMSSLGQLVAGVAHEINNPVSFIQGNLPYAEQYIQDILHILTLYQQQYPEPGATLEAAIAEVELPFIQQDLLRLLNSMRVGVIRIRDIVQSLRNFSRLDEAAMKPVDIHEGINNSLMILEHRLRAQAERPEIQVIKDYGALPEIECYAGQLNQVFMNLLVNAIDALDEAAETMPDLKPCIRISTTIVKGDRVAICIADNGFGIPEAIKPKLFNPFFTTKPVGKGTGMGLSISYQIVTQKHQGTLECHSTPGNGTKFVIEIPMQQPMADIEEEGRRM